MLVSGLLLFACASVLIESNRGQSATRFTSQADTYMVDIGESVLLHCGVAERGTHAVQWVFVEHDAQLSQNTEVLHADITTRYTITQQRGSETWDLLIRSVQSSDHGHYRCQVDDTDLRLVHELIVRDPSRPDIPAAVPHSNFTLCCAEHGVSPTCMGPCDPASFREEDFDSSRDCIVNDLVPLIACGSDGRNHAPCCYRRNLPEHCIPFCSNLVTSDLLDLVRNDAQFGECLDRATDIVYCFEEGQLLLPGPPVDATADSESPGSITARWTAPTTNAAQLTAYKVFYKRTSDTAYTHTSLLDSNTLQYVIPSLSPNTQYTVYVVAVGQHGSSLPSNTLTVWVTAAEEIEPDSTDMETCCRQKAVSPACIPVLCTSTSVTYTQHEAYTCLAYTEAVFECAAGRRNHTLCCEHRGIPDVCFPICAGHTVHIEDVGDTIDCLDNHMSQINACFEEGRDTIPSQPRRVRVDGVRARAAVVKWDPPRDTDHLVDHYMVTYTTTDSQTATDRHTVNAGEALQVSLSSLSPNTLYSVRVAAVGPRGSSLPSTVVTFRTYFDNGHVVATLPPLPSVIPDSNQNLRDCCAAEDVDNQCLVMCDYNVDYSQIDTPQLITCLGFLGTMLMCGADGRNHTSCCHHEGIPQSCVHFCAFDRQTAESYQINFQTDLTCVGHLNDIRSCMQRGVRDRPKWPSELQVTQTDANSISLLWQQPGNVQPETITGYIVEYQQVLEGQEMHPHNWNTVYLGGNQTTHIVQNLRSDTTYSIRAKTITQDSTSLASPALLQTTLPSASDSPTWLPNSTFVSQANVTDCCRQQGVSTDCMGGCNGQSIQIGQCSTDIGKLMYCVSDTKDHTPCCRRYHVPQVCHIMCSGAHHTPTITDTACLAYANEMLTCMSRGHDTLPSVPMHVRIMEYTTSSIHLAWNPPTDNWQTGVYTLHYKIEGEENYRYVNSIEETGYILEGLQPDTGYLMYVVAVNEHGSSSPTTAVLVRTLRAATPVVTLIQEPGGYIDLHHDVTLVCSVDSDLDIDNIAIVHQATGITYPMTDGHVYTIDPAIPTDSGTWTCVATNVNGAQGTHSLVLRVRGSPVASAKPTVTVALREPALLHCNVTGYPTNVTWLINNQPVDTLHLQHFEGELPIQGIVQSVLRLPSVLSHHYGQYTCVASNQFDTSTAHIMLVDPSGGTPPPVSVDNIQDVTGCCEEKGVVTSCVAACVFDIDLTYLSDPTHLALCRDNLDEMMECMANGRDHRRCCIQEHVPMDCLPFCYGGRAEEQHVPMCSTHINTIADCMNEGKNNIPSAPTSVDAVLQTNGHIVVTWGAPHSNSDKVQYYEVRYTGEQSGQVVQATKNINVEGHLREVDIGGLLSSTTYSITVLAHNHHGSSQQSDTVYVITPAFTPSAPQNLKFEVIDGGYVRLYWEKPAVHPGGVTKYIIYYRLTTDEKLNQVKVDGDTQTYRLDHLEPSSKYEVYVKATSANYMSVASNRQIITTPSADPNAIGKTDGGDDNKGTVVGLAVFFTILVVVVVAALGWFYYVRFYKTGRPLLGDSVAFENPSYATREQQVHVRRTATNNNESQAPQGKQQQALGPPAGPPAEPPVDSNTGGEPEGGENSQFQYTRMPATVNPNAVDLQFAKEHTET